MTNPETKKHDPVPNMTKKEALDTLLHHVAQGKKDIAQGNYYTSVEEVYSSIMQEYKYRSNKE